MTTSESGSPPGLGFLTVLEHDQLGLVGGYLVLNVHGRPLEFHCTAPVKANRAQQILFGPTLDSYLYGEQIGQTLLGKCSLELLGVCTDVERALSVREYVSLPVSLVLTDSAAVDGHSAIGAPTTNADETAADHPGLTTGAGPVWRVDAAHRAAPHLCEFSIGANRLAVPAHRQDDRETITGRLENLGEFDLAEPFQRIRQAVEEAHRSGRA